MNRRSAWHLRPPNGIRLILRARDGGRSLGCNRAIRCHRPATALAQDGMNTMSRALAMILTNDALIQRIHHLLHQMPYEEVEQPQVELPQRLRHKDYLRVPTPAQFIVPEAY